jgi:hypothetical protein
VSAITRAEIDALPAFPLIEPDFLTRDEHAALLGFADARIELFGETTPNGDYWQGRTLMPEQIPDPSIRQTLRDLQSRTIERLTALLAAEFDESPPIFQISSTTLDGRQATSCSRMPTAKIRVAHRILSLGVTSLR